METISSRLNRLIRWFRALNPWVIDGVLGTLLTVFSIGGLYSGGNSNHVYRDPDALGIALALACSLPFYFRRKRPLTVHLIVIVALVILSTRDYQSNAQAQMLILTSYAVGAYCEGIKRVIGFGALVLGLITVAIIGIPDSDATGILVSAAFFIAGYLFGSTVRNRRLYLEQLEARALLLEKERDEEAERAVALERVRIAQDLHDVVAHSMGVIAVQAGMGAHVIDTDPVEAKKALEAIADTSRRALHEIRRMLGVLRADDGAEYAPAPGLGDLERLVHGICDAGVDAHVTWSGVREELPAGVDFTAYRIVQESLTNVLKHAGPNVHVDVAITYEPSSLRIEVVDDGRGVNGRAPTGGHGLLGMRERVTVFGGSFQAGPCTGGGFRVAATLPYEADS